MHAVPSLTPAITGIPARRPSASAAAGAQLAQPRPERPGRGHDRRSHAGGQQRRLVQRRLVPLERGRRLAREPQAERVPRREQPRGPLDGRRLLARQPRHRRQQPEPARAAGRRSPVLPGDRRSHGLPGGVDHGQRRALPHPADRQHIEPGGPDRSHGRRDRRPPVGRRLLRAPVGADVHRVPRPPEAQQPPVEPDRRRLGLGRPEVDADDRRDAGRALRHAPGRPPPPPPRGARTSAASRSPARPRRVERRLLRRPRPAA